MHTNTTVALNPNFMRFAFHIFGLKMLSSSLYTMLKLSKTKSPQKLFQSDCITLYLPECVEEGPFTSLLLSKVHQGGYLYII